MPRGRVQREVQAEDIGSLHEVVERNIFSSLLLVLRKTTAVVVLYAHAERSSSLRHCLANAAHAQDAEDFVLGVVAEVEVLAAPFTFAEVLEGDCDSAEGAEHEEEGGCIISLVSGFMSD